MFEVPNFLKKGEDKVKKVAKIGTLAVGIGAGAVLGGNKVEAQPNFDNQEEKIAVDSTSVNNPEQTELNEQKINSNPGNKIESDNSEQLLNDNIKKVENELEQIKSQISLETTEDGSKSEQLIKEYEQYLINPNLEVKKVGEVEFKTDNKVINKTDYDFNEYFNKNIKNYNPAEFNDEKVRLIQKEIEAYKANIADEEFFATRPDPAFADKLRTTFQEDLKKEENKLKEVLGERANDIARYEKARQEYDAIKEKLILHVANENYLDKLSKEYNCSITEAKKIQTARIDAIKAGDYKLTEDFSGFTWRHNPDGSIIPNSPKTSLEYDIDNKDEVMTHEVLGHKSTFAELGLSEKAKQILKEAYRENPEFLLKYAQREKFDTSTPETTQESFKKISDYMSMISEIYARKKNLEMAMELLGVKKQGEVFTKEHLIILDKLQKENKLSNSASDFLDIVKPEYLEIIMNELADNSIMENNDNRQSENKA